MRRNFRYPTFPAGDNPAGRTRGRQTVAALPIIDQSSAAATAPPAMAFAPDTTSVTVASSQYVASGPSAAGFMHGPVQHSPPVGPRQQLATQARYTTDFGAVRPSPIDSTVVVYPGSLTRAPNPSRFETPQAPQVPIASSAVGGYISPRLQTGVPRSYGDEYRRAEEVAAILQDRSRWEAEREQAPAGAGTGERTSPQNDRSSTDSSTGGAGGGESSDPGRHGTTEEALGGRARRTRSDECPIPSCPGCPRGGDRASGSQKARRRTVHRCEKTLRRRRSGGRQETTRGANGRRKDRARVGTPRSSRKEGNRGTAGMGTCSTTSLPRSRTSPDSADGGSTRFSRATLPAFARSLPDVRRLGPKGGRTERRSSCGYKRRNRSMDVSPGTISGSSDLDSSRIKISWTGERAKAV